MAFGWVIMTDLHRQHVPAIPPPLTRLADHTARWSSRLNDHAGSCVSLNALHHSLVLRRHIGGHALLSCEMTNPFGDWSRYGPASAFNASKYAYVGLLRLKASMEFCKAFENRL